MFVSRSIWRRLAVQKAASLTPSQRATVRERGDRARNKEQKEQWEIAARNEPLFQKSFRDLMQELFTPKMAADVSKALGKSNATVESVLKVVPFFNVKDPSTFPIWNAFAVRLQNSYSSAVLESSLAESKRQGFKRKTKKAKVPKPVLPTLPVNPQSVKFIRERSLTRAVEMSNNMRETVAEILGDAFEEGLSPSAIVAEIKDTVGLTKKMRARVKARATKMKEEGFTQTQIKTAREKFSNQLRTQRAETIARTETLDAQTQGIKDAWQTAQDDGLMPKGTKKKWVATNDDRLSDICEELDNQEVPIDDQFDSSIVGPVDRPPAHPNCRSTMVLIFP